MNKDNYRLIFNLTRGCIMAVSKTSSKSSKSASGTTPTRRRQRKRCRSEVYELNRPLAVVIRRQSAMDLVAFDVTNPGGVHAGGNINLGAITIQDSVDATRDAKKFTRFGQSQYIGSQVSAAADISAARPVSDCFCLQGSPTDCCPAGSRFLLPPTPCSPHAGPRQKPR